MRHEAAWQQGDRNARTLVKQPGLRIVLTLMKGGARLRDHRAPGPISVQTLAGHIRLHVSGETIDLPAGHLLTLAGGLPHEVEAVEESAFLLTIAWPDGRGVEG
jgi:quercetin dioxygenase-like cupin family protein